MATALASRDLRRAAVRLWSTPLEAALSSALEASRARVWAEAGSLSIAVRTFLVEVFSEERTALFRAADRSFCLLRLIWDLVFAIGRGVYQPVRACPGDIRACRREAGACPVR